jgi:mono/diheme cytochrome c family protein
MIPRPHAMKFLPPAALLGLALSLPAAAQGTSYASIERGRYLVKAGDCAACHTDDGGRPFAGGRAIGTPFGTIYSTNITPDRATGIGQWSEPNFFRAMHYGIRRDGKHLYPAFPYPWFTKLSRDDVAAIKTYLDTLQPVRQWNKPPELPWPLSVREAVAAWNAMNFHPGNYRIDPDKSAQWNRGAYLVEGAGHCGACHTPSNFLGASKEGKRLQGNDYGDSWFAPGLTSNLKDGLGSWSAEDIVAFLKTGSNAKTAAAGPMAQVVKDSTQYLSDADLDAIAAYLKDIPATSSEGNRGVNSPDDAAVSRGEALYADNCTGCHMENGAGLPQVFPSLTGNSAVQASRADSVTHVILAGAKIPATSGKPTGLSMPAFNHKLNDDEIADLVSYIRNAWGNHASPTSAAEVAKVRKTVEHGGG